MSDAGKSHSDYSNCRRGRGKGEWCFTLVPSYASSKCWMYCWSWVEVFFLLPGCKNSRNTV